MEDCGHMRGFQPLEEEDGVAFGDEVIAEMRTKRKEIKETKGTLQASERNTG